MARYDFRCICNEDCVADNGVKFYAGEEYYVDEQYSGEFYYEAFTKDYKFLSYVSYEFLGDYFRVIPSIEEEIDNLFNDIMNG
jgi:hypothetical protein